MQSFLSKGKIILQTVFNLTKGRFSLVYTIIIKYKIGDKSIINIYDIFSGNQIKKIELLK